MEKRRGRSGGRVSLRAVRHHSQGAPSPWVQRVEQSRTGSRLGRLSLNTVSTYNLHHTTEYNNTINTTQKFKILNKHKLQDAEYTDE